MKIIDKIDKQLDEIYQMVKLQGLPNIVMKGGEASVRMQLKKRLRKPDDILSIEKVTKGEMKKYFRELGAGKESEEEESVDEASLTNLFIMRVWPKGKKPAYFHIDNKTSKAIPRTFSNNEVKKSDVSVILGAEVIGNVNSHKLANLLSFNEGLDEGRDFSNSHYAVVKGKMYGDTQSIYILDTLGGRIQHLGFGDFGTSNPIKLPGVGEVKVEYVRADGSATGNALKKAGFSGRPHYVDFPGIDKPEKAAKELAKIYKKKGSIEVKI